MEIMNAELAKEITKSINCQLNSVAVTISNRVHQGAYDCVFYLDEQRNHHDNSHDAIIRALREGGYYVECKEEAAAKDLATPKSVTNFLVICWDVEASEKTGSPSLAARA